MSRFIQLHLLTSYPPANLNRDDLGRPKTARMGGVDRLRVSSQSLKRAWRTSDLFEAAMAGNIGTRTQQLGVKMRDRLREKGIDEKKSKAWAQEIAKQFAKLKSPTNTEPDLDLETGQLVHISPAEWQAAEALADKLTAEKRPPTEDELKALRKRAKAVDIAFFGRMLADHPADGVEAAVQVGHALSVHEVAIEDDYFTAVDDLNLHEKDAGAGHLGEAGFAAGLFYLYVCINRELLLENLLGDGDLANRAISAFAETLAKVGPTGKQNSFASRAYASYILAEKGDQQPRSLSVSFLNPVGNSDMLREAVIALEGQRGKMDKAYGPCADAVAVMDVDAEKGSLEKIIAFCTE